MARQKAVKPETKATEVKKADTKAAAEPVKEEAEQPVSEKAEEVEAEEKEEAPAKKPGRKPGTKNSTPAKKTTKTESKTQVIVEYQSDQVDLAKVEERVKAQFVAEGHRAGSIKILNIYVKPEDRSAYYVINEKFSGRVDLF